MALETEHRGYKIRYGENSDEWFCNEAGDGMSAPTLSKLKDKINRMIASQKKKTAVDFLVIEDSGIIGNRKTLLTEARMTGYSGPEVSNKGYSSLEKVVTGHKVEAVYVGRKWGKSDERAARRVVNLKDCCPDTDAVRKALAEVNRLGEAAKLADKAHREAIEAIPRLTLADIDTLVKLSGIDPTGGLKE